ncbi:hypothetical protein VM1G_02905 [Cytospora mali]|uniref:Vegetative incompatibility protein HET-E-1 n=1 Tax=Cytospora mali TaxID=578113 RepID=A0A194VTX4_CYTMA|nr:hypothetical protein VM1G_02905 [Valsa mali]
MTLIIDSEAKAVAVRLFRAETSQRPSRAAAKTQRLSCREAARKAGCSRTSVSKHLRDLRAGVESRPRGRPPALTNSEDNALVAYILTIEKTSYGADRNLIVNACNRLRAARTPPAAIPYYAEVQFQQPQYWVIDGLDECANPASLFPLLAKIEKKARLRVFVTSQPSLVFERSFAREDTASIAETIPLDATLSDIRIYLNEHSSYFLCESEDERQELDHTILDMSNGNFLWTDLVVKRIENAVSKEQVHTILNSVPKEMDQLYREITSSIMTSPETASIAKAILRWTLCSLRPLSVDELREALRLDIGESLSQLDKTAGAICGNLVYVDGDSRDDFEYGMKREREHTRITQICLSYLSGDDDMKPRTFRRANSHAHKKEAKRSIFSNYAVVYFSDQIAHSSSSSGEQLATLNRFLMSNHTTWIEAIASTKDLIPLTRTANNLKAYMDRRVKYESPLAPKSKMS